MFPHCFEESVEKMTRESTSVRSMNPHPRIDVVKFNGTNNFGMWRCEVMDALTASNLEDTLHWRKARFNYGRRLGQDELYGMWLDQVLSDTRH